MNENENLLLPAHIRDALARYLALRPWQEVHEVMPHLMNLAPAPASATILNASQPQDQP